MVLDFFAKKTEPRPILVVDDSESVRTLIQDILQEAGYATLSAADGRSAFELARSRMPCLILLDINMPDWSGLRTLSEMRALPELRDIPVLMVTAEQAGKEVESAFARGAKGYVIKPIEMRRFLKKVAEFVAPPGAAVDSGSPEE